MVKKRKPSKKELQRESRHYSIKEGLFSSIKTSLTTSYLTPFAIAINTSNPLIALFSAFAGIFGPITQIFGSKLIENNSRKKILVKSILAESFSILILVLIAALYFFNIFRTGLPIILFLSYMLYTILSSIGAPAWFSWMGDIVDKKYRGRWFSKRNLLIGATTLPIALFASIFLDKLEQRNLAMIGFGTIFLISFVARIISWKNIKKQYEPKIKVRKEDNFSFANFLSHAKDNSFGRFTIFRFTFAFAMGVTTPFVAIYFLKNLGYSYFTYMAVTLSTTIFSLILVELWGKFADKYGNYSVLKITTWMFPFYPLLIILNPSPIYMIFVPHLLGGISWAGFNLGVGNFIYENVSKERRGMSVSYYNLMLGMGTFLGAGFGALLIKFLHTSSIKPIILIFIIGGILRIISVLFFFPKIKYKHNRNNGPNSITKFLSKETIPTLNEEMHQLTSIPHYLKIR